MKLGPAESANGSYVGYERKNFNLSFEHMKARYLRQSKINENLEIRGVPLINICTWNHYRIRDS